MKIPFESCGEAGPALHFAHANGYPPGAYRALMARLAERYRVFTMHMRPLWPGSDPYRMITWEPLSQDLADFLDQQELDRVIGAGHSMGAVATLRLALCQPERFHALILIDPVLFPPWMNVAWDLMYQLHLGYRLHPLVRGAMRRYKTFASIEVMYTNYRQKKVFRRLSDTALQDYVNALARPRPDGSVELAYPPEWEARIYVTGVRGDRPLWRELPRLRLPLLIIRGGDTDTFWESTSHLVQRKLPSAHVITIPAATHLVPLEAPEVVANAMLEFLKK